MIDVACFCGCFYSFEDGAGPCPKCGEVAAVTAAPELETTGLSRPEQPVAEMNGAGPERGYGGTCRPWAEADGDPIAGIAIMPDSELTESHLGAVVT
jgi:hypothetical protein